jgi:hypothetical protein
MVLFRFHLPLARYRANMRASLLKLRTAIASLQLLCAHGPFSLLYVSLLATLRF